MRVRKSTLLDAGGAPSGRVASLCMHMRRPACADAVTFHGENDAFGTDMAMVDRGLNVGRVLAGGTLTQ